MSLKHLRKSLVITGSEGTYEVAINEFDKTLNRELFKKGD